MDAPTTSTSHATATGTGARRVYGERATRRLMIAARLLRRQGLTVETLGDAFCPTVLDLIHALDEVRRERLRQLVDWVEAYEKEEAGVLAQGERRRMASRPDR